MFRASFQKLRPNIKTKKKKKKSSTSQTISKTKKKKDKTPNQDDLFPIQTPFLPQEFQGIEEEEEEEEEEEIEEEAPAFDIKSSASSNIHGVQPLGNLLLSPSPYNSRNPGLGNLSSLPDDLLIDILSLLGPTQLAQLSIASKALYVFSNHDPLWRALVLDSLHSGFSFTGSWKSTYVSVFYPSFSGQASKGIQVRDFYSDYLFQSWLCASLEMKPEWLEIDNIERRCGISVEEFVSGFEELNKPVLLEGCLEKWAAVEKWDRDYLARVCGDTAFSVGPVEMKLGEYFRYADLVKEERPLYLFDPKFAEKVPQLGADYEVPPFFREDLFAVLGVERPDYRWAIIGPTGSGSSFHVDPNSTSAWNAVIRGSKKWVLFPPDVVPPGVHPSPDGAEVACPVSIIEWFMNFYGATKKWKRRPVECVCRAGEVVFVPNGWWHLVINLEDSIAITQNYVSRKTSDASYIARLYFQVVVKPHGVPKIILPWTDSRRNLLNVLDFLKRPNASELVSGTRDRVNLYDKFRTAVEASYPGIIDEATWKAEEKKAQQKKPTFWESVTDAKVGGFKFSF